MSIFIISDLHFNHKNILEYSKRPWNSLYEMQEGLIANWNSVVSPEDKVYFLGDFAFGRHSVESDRNLLLRLNGDKEIILGNHDLFFKEYNKEGASLGKVTRVRALEYWKEVGFSKVHSQPIVLDKYFILSHEPIDGLNETQIFANIHGHTHNVNIGVKNYYNVSVENINYTPINFEEIKEFYE